MWPPRRRAVNAENAEWWHACRDERARRPSVSQVFGHGCCEGCRGACYDAAAETHLDWLSRIEGDPRMRYLGELLQRLAVPSRVLELGCGAGVPVTARLASQHCVTGIDLSAAQLELARKLVPTARFIHADMAAFDPDDEPYDAVTAFYSVSHVPRDLHAELFRRIASWLRPGGLFLASLGANGCPDTVQQWLGVPMFFSSFDADENRGLLREAGFELLTDDVVSMQEPEGSATFLWVLAHLPDVSGAS